MKISTRVFGTTPLGETVTAYRIENKNGMQAEVIDFGAILVSLLVPGQEKKLTDVVLGYDSLEGYLTNPAYFGSTIGRNGNRIAKAEFELNGKTYHLSKNEGNHSLHSDPNGYHKRIWKSEMREAEQSVVFSLHSPDGDQGFPGNLDITVTYCLTDENELVLTYDGVSDQDTVINMTNHSYFQLSGHDAGQITEHKLRIKASSFTAVDKESIPTGEIVSVVGTPLDFTNPKRIGDEIDAAFEQLQLVGGFDHNFVIDKVDWKQEKIAVLSNETGSLSMEVYTDCPGVQFYSGNFIKEHSGKGGTVYKKRSGLCLETQYFPDAVNQKEFASPIFKTGQPYHSMTKYKFLSN